MSVYPFFISMGFFSVLNHSVYIIHILSCASALVKDSEKNVRLS